MATSATPTQSQGRSKKITLEDVRRDWRVLDDPGFEPPRGVRLISHEEFTSVPELPVEYVPPSRLACWLRFAHRVGEPCYPLAPPYRCRAKRALEVERLFDTGIGVLR